MTSSPPQSVSSTRKGTEQHSAAAGILTDVRSWIKSSRSSARTGSRTSWKGRTRARPPANCVRREPTISTTAWRSNRKRRKKHMKRNRAGSDIGRYRTCLFDLGYGSDGFHGIISTEMFSNDRRKWQNLQIRYFGRSRGSNNRKMRTKKRRRTK